MRIIGVEFRLDYQSRYGFRREEIGIVPCQIEIHFPIENLVRGGPARLSGTIHTDYGDFNFGQGGEIQLSHDMLDRSKEIRARVRQG